MTKADPILTINDTCPIIIFCSNNIIQTDFPIRLTFH